MLPTATRGWKRFRPPSVRSCGLDLCYTLHHTSTQQWKLCFYYLWGLTWLWLCFKTEQSLTSLRWLLYITVGISLRAFTHFNTIAANNLACCVSVTFWSLAMHRCKLLNSDCSTPGPSSAKRSLFFIRVSEAVGENTCVWQQQQQQQGRQPDSLCPWKYNVCLYIWGSILINLAAFHLKSSDAWCRELVIMSRLKRLKRQGCSWKINTLRLYLSRISELTTLTLRLCSQRPIGHSRPFSMWVSEVWRLCWTFCGP